MVGAMQLVGFSCGSAPECRGCDLGQLGPLRFLSDFSQFLSVIFSTSRGHCAAALPCLGRREQLAGNR